MNIEDFDNELSEDDTDYNPQEQPDSVSENSGPDYDDPENSDNESGAKKTKKRQKASKRRKANKQDDDNIEVEEVKSPTVDPDEEKRRSDALWADFLDATETPAEPKKSVNKVSATATTTTSKAPIIPTAKAPATTIFEFAGETVEIPAKSTADTKPAAGVKRPSGGLSSVLNQLTKKNKLSVLEKTKLDWDGFKSNEGISEELQTHNRGRDGSVYAYFPLPSSPNLTLFTDS